MPTFKVRVYKRNGDIKTIEYVEALGPNNAYKQMKQKYRPPQYRISQAFGPINIKEDDASPKWNKK